MYGISSSKNCNKSPVYRILCSSSICSFPFSTRINKYSPTLVILFANSISISCIPFDNFKICNFNSSFESELSNGNTIVICGGINPNKGSCFSLMASISLIEILFRKNKIVRIFILPTSPFLYLSYCIAVCTSTNVYNYI